jgi:hypothetical protein
MLRVIEKIPLPLLPRGTNLVWNYIVIQRTSGMKYASPIKLFMVSPSQSPLGPRHATSAIPTADFRIPRYIIYFKSPFQFSREI